MGTDKKTSLARHVLQPAESSASRPPERVSRCQRGHIFVKKTPRENAGLLTSRGAFGASGDASGVPLRWQFKVNPVRQLGSDRLQRDRSRQAARMRVRTGDNRLPSRVIRVRRFSDLR